MRNRVFFLWRFSIKSEDYSTNYGFLKRIISADDVVSDAFRWHHKQNGGVTGTYSANFYWWILHAQSTPLNNTKERFSNMTVLNSHKERTVPPPRHLKRGGHRPPHFKNCSAGPVVQTLDLWKRDLISQNIKNQKREVQRLLQSWFKTTCIVLS